MGPRAGLDECGKSRPHRGNCRLLTILYSRTQKLFETRRLKKKRHIYDNFVVFMKERAQTFREDRKENNSNI